MKMCGWAKGGSVKWDLAEEGSTVEVAGEDAGADGAEVVSISVGLTSVVGSEEASTVSACAGSATSVVGAVGDVVAFGACSIGIARQSTVKISPGFNSVFGLRTYICQTTQSRRRTREKLTTVPLSLTFPPTTNALACHTLLAKQALNTKTSSRLSTSLNIIVPTGADPSSSFFLANFSSLVRPPARSRPSIHFAIELVLF